MNDIVTIRRTSFPAYHTPAAVSAYQQSASQVARTISVPQFHTSHPAVVSQQPGYTCVLARFRSRSYRRFPKCIVELQPRNNIKYLAFPDQPSAKGVV